MSSSEAHRVLHRAAVISVVVGIGMLAIKMGAFLVTGSAAILSDALESVVHVAATIVMLATLRFSLAPPDRGHPYGHGKAAAFSVGFEGGLVALSGILVLIALVERLVNGSQLVELGLGLWGTGLAAAINLWLGIYLVRVGRRHDNSVLVADGQHVLADVWTSAGVLIGLFLVWLSGWQWIDLVVAGLVAVHLIWVGTSLVREGLRELMGEVDDATYGRILAALNEIREADWYDIHRLRVHRVGDLWHIDFHLSVPADWSVAHGHIVSERIERHVLSRLEARGTVLIHLDIVAHRDELVDEGRYPFVDTELTVEGATRTVAGPSDQPVSDEA